MRDLLLLWYLWDFFKLAKLVVTTVIQCQTVSTALDPPAKQMIVLFFVIMAGVQFHDGMLGLPV